MLEQMDTGDLADFKAWVLNQRNVFDAAQKSPSIEWYMVAMTTVEIDRLRHALSQMLGSCFQFPSCPDFGDYKDHHYECPIRIAWDALHPEDDNADSS